VAARGAEESGPDARTNSFRKHPVRHNITECNDQRKMPPFPARLSGISGKSEEILAKKRDFVCQAKIFQADGTPAAPNRVGMLLQRAGQWPARSDIERST
jgi:hypothetical protein